MEPSNPGDRPLFDFFRPAAEPIGLLSFDATGGFSDACVSAAAPGVELPVPISRIALDGSWYAVLRADDKIRFHGVLRVESRLDNLRISGDFYTANRQLARTLLPLDPSAWETHGLGSRVGKHWYPHLPKTRYSFHVCSRRPSYDYGSGVVQTALRCFQWLRARNDEWGLGQFGPRTDATLDLHWEARKNLDSLTASDERPALVGKLAWGRRPPMDVIAVKTAPWRSK